MSQSDRLTAYFNVIICIITITLLLIGVYHRQSADRVDDNHVFQASILEDTWSVYALDILFTFSLAGCLLVYLLSAAIKGYSVIKLVKNVLATSVELLGAVVVSFFAVLLLGAPLSPSKNFTGTCYVSILLALLVAFPAFKHCGVSQATWFSVLTLNDLRASTRRLVWQSGLSLAAGWCLSILLVMDWNKAWNVFPVPPLFGLASGFLIGTYAIL